MIKKGNLKPFVLLNANAIISQLTYTSLGYIILHAKARETSMEEKCRCTSSKIKIRTEEDKKKIINRIQRLIGQMNGVKNMIEDNRYCDDVLIQLAAIDKAIKSLANVILEDHMHSCLIENIQNGNVEVVDEIVDLFKRFQ